MGRNYDYEESYGEKLWSIEKNEYGNEYAIVGVCTNLIKEHPLMYDGMNEHGLCCSALAFDGNAVYKEVKEDMINIPAYDVVFQILSKYDCVESLIDELPSVNITNEQYNENVSNTDLHWFVCDTEKSIIIEQTRNGLEWFDGDVMTNNPPYAVQRYDYESCKYSIGDGYEYNGMYRTRGRESSGLDGDYTSMGRFERLSWLLSQCTTEFSPILESMHLLASVEQIYGATPVNDKFEYTIYSIIYDMKGKDVYLKFYDENGYTCHWGELE